MRNIIIASFMFLVFSMYSNFLYATSVDVNITKVVSKYGNIKLFVCDQASFSYENKETGCLIYKKVAIVNGKSSYKIKLGNIKQGQWAILGYIDENNNEKLDMRFGMFPKEPILYTVDIKGPPRFSKVHSDITGKTQIINIEVQ